MFITTRNISLNTEIQQLAFINLLDASREGLHFIWIPKQDLTEIIQKYSNLDFLGLPQKKAFEDMLHNIGDDAHQYINKLTIKLVIDFESTNPQIFNNPTNKEIISSHINYTESCSLRECVLLAENTNDARFYECLASIYKEKILAKDTRIQHQLRRVSGSGDSTHESFTEEVKTIQPVLCILDSDKKHPGQTTPGETAKKVLSAQKELQGNEIFSIQILTVRAIENLMPINLLEAIKKEGADLGLVFYDENPDFKRFVKCKDFQYRNKEGKVERDYITLDDVEKKLCPDPKVGSFWQSFYNKYKESHSSDRIVCSNLHKDLQGRNCRKIGFIGLCIQTIQDNIDVRNSMIADNDSDWNKIAHEVFSWTFSYQKQLA